MKGIIRFALLTVILTSCLVKEDPVNESSAYGLYARDYSKIREFICLDQNNNYTYYIEEDGQLKTLTSNVWHFDLENGESRIGLSKFDYLISLKKYAKTPYGVSAPILYSHAKKAIVIRMEDDHFRDFVKIDSLCTASSLEAIKTKQLVETVLNLPSMLKFSKTDLIQKKYDTISIFFNQDSIADNINSISQKGKTLELLRSFDATTSEIKPCYVFREITINNNDAYVFVVFDITGGLAYGNLKYIDGNWVPAEDFKVGVR